MAGLKQLNWASEGVGATAAALVDLSTVAGNKISNPPWVKFQSAGWVNFPSAPTHFAFLTDIRKRQPVSHLIDSDSSFHQMLNALKNEHEIIPNTTRIHFELSETSFERFKGEGKSGLKPIDKILLFLDSVPLRINALQVSESEQHRLDILFKHYEDLNDVVKELNQAIYIDREKHTNTFSIVEAARKIITLTKEIEALK